MEDRIAQSAQTGAFTLMLLVQNYRSQIIALLLKNGITVPSGASDKQIIQIMSNLLKISKSFYKDITLFLQNPKVLKNLSGAFSQNAEYFRADGFGGKKQGNAQYFRADGFMNYTGDRFNIPDVSFKPDDVEVDETTDKPQTGGSTGGFWSGLNLAKILEQGLGAFASLDKNKTDRAIAEARAKAGLPPLDSETTTYETNEDGTITKKKTPDNAMSATTIVVLSLVGIAVIGTIIYFVSKPKKV